MFVEGKTHSEKSTDSELTLIWGAQWAGIPLGHFAVARAAISFPERPTK